MTLKTTKMTKKLFNTLILMVILSALYRILPFRPWGFVPQFSISLFGGYLFANDKKWSFFLPLMSMIISDIIYQTLFLLNMSPIIGFYDGQLLNYGLFMIITCFGFGINPNDNKTLLRKSLLAPTFFFLVSNFIVWISGGGYHRSNLLECYIDGIPFFTNSILGSIFFTFLIFKAHNIFTIKLNIK